MTTPPQNVAPLNTRGQNFIKFNFKKTRSLKGFYDWQNEDSNYTSYDKFPCTTFSKLDNIDDFFVQCKEDSRKLDVTVLLLL